MHRELRPRPRIAPCCAYCRSRQQALEPADRHAFRLGIAGHVESCRRANAAPLRERPSDVCAQLAYAALIAAPLIKLAASTGWTTLPGAPLATIAA
jgi:hypothetical protein